MAFTEPLLGYKDVLQVKIPYHCIIARLIAGTPWSWIRDEGPKYAVV